MAMRTKELESFRMQVNEKGQVKVSLPSQLVQEMEAALLDEAGLKCCICLEGYKNQPKKVLHAQSFFFFFFFPFLFCAFSLKYFPCVVM